MSLSEDDPMQLYQKFTESFNKIAKPDENGKNLISLKGIFPPTIGLFFTFRPVVQGDYLAPMQWFWDVIGLFLKKYITISTPF